MQTWAFASDRLGCSTPPPPLPPRPRERPRDDIRRGVEDFAGASGGHRRVGRGLPGRRGVRPAGARRVHHRPRLAAAELAQEARAGADRPRRHHDADDPRHGRLRLARRLGLQPRRALGDLGFGPLPGDLRRRRRLARQPWRVDCRPLVRALQRRLAPAQRAAGHRPSQHDPDVLDHHPRLRDHRPDGGRGHRAQGARLSSGRERVPADRGLRRYGAEVPQVHGSPDADESRRPARWCGRSRLPRVCSSPSSGA